MKIDLNERVVSVHLRCSDWERALDVISDYRDAPPDGYKMVGASVAPRTRNGGNFNSGRRCNLMMVFEHVDRRVKPFTKKEAYDFFRKLEKSLQVPACHQD